MLDALVNRPNTILEQQKRFQVNLTSSLFSSTAFESADSLSCTGT